MAITQYYHTRWMVMTDLDEVYEIDRLSFDHPWTKEQIKDQLYRQDTVSMVVESINIDRIIGYMVYELQDHNIYLEAIAVHPYFRKQKVGSSLLFRLTSDMLRNGRREIATALVKETNLSAQLFFKFNGWKAIKVIKGVNANNQPEDIYKFVWNGV